MPPPFALALETSGRLGSVAVMRGATILAQGAVSHDLKHASGLLPLVDALTKQAGLTPAVLSFIYVSAGPGSFTGLRIGITLAKTLALAVPVRLVAVPSLSALAYNAPAEAVEVVPVLDAKRDQIFTARFARRGTNWVAVEPARLDTLAAVLARAGRPVHLLGEGLPYHEKFIPPNDAGIVKLPPDLWQPRAAVVGTLGFDLASAGHFVDPATFVPTYVRRPEAEEKFDARVPT